MNFLLGLGLLILIVFYFAGVYLIYLPLSAIAPNWAGPAAGFAVLVAAGVTVQLLSMAMSDLRGIALYNKSERAGALAYASQAALILGHIGTIYAAKGLIFDGVPVANATVLIIAALYSTGAALALQEWRQRKFSRT